MIDKKDHIKNWAAPKELIYLIAVTNDLNMIHLHDEHNHKYFIDARNPAYWYAINANEELAEYSESFLKFMHLYYYKTNIADAISDSIIGFRLLHVYGRYNVIEHRSTRDKYYLFEMVDGTIATNFYFEPGEIFVEM